MEVDHILFVNFAPLVVHIDELEHLFCDCIIYFIFLAISIFDGAFIKIYLRNLIY